MPDMHPTLQAALTRRDAALAEARRWDDFIRMWYELQGASLEGVRGPEGEAADLFEPSGHVATSRPAMTRSAVRGDQTNEVAAAIVAERGPMFTRPLLPLMEEHGHPIVGKDPYNVLHTRLTRGKLLEFDKVVGWRLREQPRQTNEAAGPPGSDEPAASSETPNDAERRGEVDHEIGP